MNKSEVAKLLNPRTLQLIILPTEQCNFRCTYCYEDFALGRMKRSTVEAIKKLISKRLQKIDLISVSWFGGEPLLAKDIIIEINKHIIDEIDSKNVTFHSNITTNAYTLSKSIFENLVSSGVTDYQISLDGEKAEHDKTRKLSTGIGTFEKVWKNLLELRTVALDFNVVMRLHVHQNNFNSIERLVQDINRYFSDDMRFSIFFKAVDNWGGEGVKDLALIKTAQPIMELQKQLDNLGWNAKRQKYFSSETVMLGRENLNNQIKSSNDTEPSRPGTVIGNVSHCYASLPNSFVIRSNGEIAKCTVAFNDQRNKVGHINDDGTLTLSNQMMHGFMRGFKSLNEDEINCPMHGMLTTEQVREVKFYPNINA